jgi:hypothetical protein
MCSFLFEDERGGVDRVMQYADLVAPDSARSFLFIIVSPFVSY